MSTGKHYKLYHGYNEADYISIDEDELAKAIALFMEGNGRAIFEEGAIRGQDIMRIIPDWHYAKGWNKGWKMTPDDYEDIRPLERRYQETYEQAKFLAEFAIKENKRELLSQPLDEAVKKLPAPQLTSNFTKQLASKFKIND